jgi:uncharacterized protein YbjT (DUF2867 family)
MKIVVTTPTGNIGSKIVKNLVRAGLRPTVIARDPAKIDPVYHPLVEIVQGDLLDGKSLLAATKGADALFWLSPPQYGQADPVGHYKKLGQVAVEAIQNEGIARVVHLSSVGAEHLSGIGLISGLCHNEVALNATSAAVRHLRAGFFYENFLMQLDALRNGQYHVNLPLDHPTAFVATADIADHATDWLLQSDWTGKSVRFVTGQKPLTTREAIAAVSEGLGREITLVEIPDSAVREVLISQGGHPDFADGYVEMMSGLRSLPIELEYSPATYAPTTLAEWAFNNLRPLL